MKLVPEAKQWHRLWSMRWAIATAMLAAIPVAYLTLPDDWLPAIPAWLKAVFAYATLATAAGTAAVRVIKQDNVKRDQ